MYPNDSADYARGRLSGTIIRHMGKAVIVNDVRHDGPKQPLRVSAMIIKDKKEISDKIDNFDLSPVPLGFVNYAKRNDVPFATYMARTPIRQDWRQGLRKQNAVFLWGAAWWHEEEIADTIEGLFPELDQALGIAKKKGGIVAWNREFAVDKDSNIYHRFYDKVGNFIDGGKRFLLDNKFFWVEENLKAVVK
jgi:hypothetical protein